MPRLNYYQRVQENVKAESRGLIDCKNKGCVEMFFIDELIEAAGPG